VVRTTDDTTIKAVQEYLNRGFDLMNEATAQFQHAAAVWAGMGGTGAQPERVVFCSPVTGVIETGANIWGGAWFDATGYAKLYDSSSGAKSYHTGVDLNLNSPTVYADSRMPVYAAAGGLVNFAGTCPGWQRSVIVIKHVLENGALVWTRYAHIDNIYVQAGDNVPRGFKIGHIADYTPAGPAGDHLHYDIAYKDIGLAPADWPGMDIARLKHDYIDPVMWHKARAQ
jgi:murein DD-endopeptidase MepM/ murein hydrolase activator NlpD